MSSEIDVVIVGAGAAGIAASRQLAKGGCSAVMVEALPRPGGGHGRQLLEDTVSILVVAGCIRLTAIPGHA